MTTDAEKPEYVTYAHMDTLHDLARPRSDVRGELTFILISQVQELLFRALVHDLDQARSRLSDDDTEAACADLSRACRTQRLLVACWDTMNGMPPDEFVAFRDVLGDASGIQSFAYRELEFLMGNRPAGHARAARADGHPRVRDELARPSVYDAALGHLARLGYDVPQAVLTRARDQHEPDVGVEEVWLTIYRDPSRHRAAHRLAESLTEVAYQFSHWRAAHLLTVERMLGGKGGTGGTDGASWVRAANEHRFFPELWTFRSRL